MKFIFEIKNKTLERIDTNVLTDEPEIICEFSFLTDEWKKKEKYIIFWDNKNKTTIISLGKKMISKCIVPKKIMQSAFTIQIYSNDNLATQKLNVAGTPPIYQDNPLENKCHVNTKINDEYNIKKIFKELFKEINSKVDKIQYKNGYLEYYAGDKLLYSSPILNNILDDIEKVIAKANFDIDNVMLDNNRILCYSKGKIIYNLPFVSDLSDVAFSGNYNDLKNIPTTFNPIKHTHKVIDITDYQSNIDFDLNMLLDFLGDEINKE